MHEDIKDMQVGAVSTDASSMGSLIKAMKTASESMNDYAANIARSKHANGINYAANAKKKAKRKMAKKSRAINRHK